MNFLLLFDQVVQAIKLIVSQCLFLYVCNNLNIYIETISEKTYPHEKKK